MGPQVGDGEDFFGDGTGGEHVRGPARWTGKILLETGQARNMYGPHTGDGEDFIGNGIGGKYLRGPVRGTGKVF